MPAACPRIARWPGTCRGAQIGTYDRSFGDLHALVIASRKGRPRAAIMRTAAGHRAREVARNARAPAGELGRGTACVSIVIIGRPERHTGHAPRGCAPLLLGHVRCRRCAPRAVDRCGALAGSHRCDRLDGMAAWLRHALRRDLGAIVDLWVDAFADDPYLRWIQPDDQRWPAFGNARLCR